MGDKFYCKQCGCLHGCNPHPEGWYDDFKSCISCGHRGKAECQTFTKGFTRTDGGTCFECTCENLEAIDMARAQRIRDPHDPVLWALKVRMYLIEIWCYLQNHKIGFLP
ncbi:MAG TPA: hypothetical protein VK254_03230 [Candidatus Bathyarchaeia archaeon]|nr:hypothetical protein [Candidatus Bathyarchaeia archaeon]